MIPQVTVIVPHHLNENDEYLSWCLKSVVASVGVDLEVICISDAPNEVCHLNPGTVKMIWDRSLTNLTKKWNYGLKLSNPATQYVMLISDDVMVSKYTIAEMVSTAGDNRMILSPASNCDSTTRYHTEYVLERNINTPLGTPGEIQIPQKCTLDDIRGYEDSVTKVSLERRILIDPGWVSFYCTLFPRKVLETVGEFDERMDCRYNDVDYCQRARSLGIPSLIHLGCFALHFGDRTLPKSTTIEEYKAADQAYAEKYHLAL
jgi:hypothetical protein